MIKRIKTLQAQRRRNAIASTLKPNTNSVPTTVAQNKTRCEFQETAVLEIATLLDRVARIKNQYPQMYYLCTVMIEGSLRVSEALAIRPQDITPTGKILIKSLKKGNERLISSGDAKDFILRCRANNTMPFQGWSRFFVYREFKKLGIYFQSSTSSKPSVTHAIRHIITASNRSVTNSNEVLAQELGHKNQKTNQRYGKAKQYKKN